MKKINNIQPLVSVCVPTYNRVEKLKVAIKNIQRQTYDNLEIIISDNHSSDETEKVCIQLQKEDDRIIYFQQNNNIGPTTNFEFVRQRAKGKYFLWHGDDDYLDKDYIEVCVNELEQNSELILVSGLAAYKKYGLGKITHYGNVIQLSSKFSVMRIIKYLWNVQENSIFCGVYNTEYVKSAYMPNVLAGDWIWMVQVLLKGKAKVMEKIHIYRSYGDSTSESYEKIIVTLEAPIWHAKYPNIAIIKNIASFFKNKNVFIGLISFIVLAVRGFWNNFKRYFKLSLLKRLYLGYSKK